MKRLGLILLNIVLAGLVLHCGGGMESPSQQTPTNQLTSQDIDHINQALSGALTDRETLLNGYQTAYSASMNRQTPCLVSGYISTVGDVTIDDTTHAYAGQMDVAVSDPANPANDCEIDDNIVLEGNLLLTVSGGARNGVSMTLSGTIGVNMRGPAGRDLPLYPDCAIHMTYVSPRDVSGTICGQVI